VSLFQACATDRAAGAPCGCLRGLVEFTVVDEIDAPERNGPMPRWTEGNVIADGSSRPLPPLVYRPQGEFTVEQVKVLGIEDVETQWHIENNVRPAWDCIGDDVNIDCDWEPEGDDWGECPHDGFPLNDHARHFARMANGETQCLACAVREVLKEAS
jgi:hypothetical protein